MGKIPCSGLLLLLLAILPRCLSAAEIPQLLFDDIGRFKPREKGEVTLSCKTFNSVTKVEYTRDNNLLLRSNDSRLASNSKNRLTISKLSYQKDDGIYRCKASTNKGTLMSLKKPLKVSTLGTFASGFRLSDTPKKIRVVIGRPVVLVCPSASYTYPNNIIWGNVRKNDDPMLLSSSEKRYQMSSGNFLFTFLKQADVNEINDQMNGVSCIFYHNGFYAQSVRFRFEVVTELKTDYAPRFQERIASRNTAKEGSEFSFYCSVGGNPSPKITWYRPGGDEITSRSKDFKISPTRHKLTLKVTYLRLAGLYRCDVRGSTGTISSRGELTVQVPPIWSEKLENRVVEANTNVELRVKAKGSGILKYDWFKNGQPIDRTNDSYTVSGNVLVIKNIQPKDFGYIQCFASNSFYEIASAAFINIEGSVIPPTKETDEEKGKVYFEYYILIGCGVLVVLGVTSLVIYLYVR